MANSERAEYSKISLSPNNPFGLTFHAPDKNRNLFIEDPTSFGQGTNKEAQDLLRVVMLAHLIARHFPKKIETNFEIQDTVFLDNFYGHYGYAKPKILKGHDTVVPKKIETDSSEKPKIIYANAHSGGLDSLYRAAKLYEKGRPVMFVHLRNLNPTGTLNEALASRAQAKAFNVPYEEVKLRNGTDNTGFAVMRTRDMLLGLVSSMVAENYGAKKVFIEGDMQTNPTSHFSEYAPAWEFFNGLIKEVGLRATVEGMDGHDIESIGEVLKIEQELGIDILPMVQNCFSPSCWVGTRRRRWEREAPEISKNSNEHWCGTCAKCRRMTLGRLFYGDRRFASVPKKEIIFFIDDTYKWLNDKGNSNNKELTSASFLRHLQSLKEKYK